MSATLVTIALTHIDCPFCHAVFGIADAACVRYRASGKSFHCPYCQGSMSYGESALDRERKAREAAERDANLQRIRADTAARLRVAAEHSTRATKGHLTRLKKRVAAGVCPCCNRTFKDLSRHMAGQHPEYVEVP